MPYSHHKLQSLRGKYSNQGTVGKAASATLGIRNLRSGPRNHDTKNDPENYDFDSWETTQEYLRRKVAKHNRKPLAYTNRGP